LAVLTQLLRSPYVAIKVARIAQENMPLEEAEIALRQMRMELEAGKTWVNAYGKFANLHPNPKSGGTIVSYLYDAIVSPAGFDILNYRTTENLPVEHLQELFRIKRGTHILKAAGGVYLYHITSYYDGGS